MDFSFLWLLLVPERDPRDNLAGNTSLHCQEDGQNDLNFNFCDSLCMSPGFTNSEIFIRDIKPNNEAYKRKRIADKAYHSQPPRVPSNKAMKQSPGRHVEIHPSEMGLQGVASNQTPCLPEM